MKGGVAPTVTNAAVRRARETMPWYSALLPRSTSMAPMSSVGMDLSVAAASTSSFFLPKKPKKPPCFFFFSCLSCALVLRFSVFFLRLMTVPTFSSEVNTGLGLDLGLTGSGAATAAKGTVRSARPTAALVSESNITGVGTTMGVATAVIGSGAGMSMSAAASSSSSVSSTSGT